MKNILNIKKKNILTMAENFSKKNIVSIRHEDRSDCNVLSLMFA